MRKVHTIGTVVLVAAFAALVGCGKKNADEPAQQQQPNPGPGPGPGPQPQPKGSSLGSPAFSLTSTEFHKEFEANRSAAEAKYARKVIEIRGVVSHVSPDDDDKNGSTLFLALAEQSTPSCRCNVADKNLAAKFGRGQNVRLKGIYNMFDGIAPTLNSCEVLEKGPDTTLPVRAEALAKEYTADSSVCKEKFGKSTLIVTGEVIAVKTDVNGTKTVELKGDGSNVISVQYNHFRGFPANYVKGARVKLAADLMYAWSRDGRVVVIMSAPLDLD